MGFRFVWIALAIFLLFASVLPGEFLRWDDRQHIVLNPWLTHGLWMRFWVEPYYGLFVPVIYSVWTGLYALLEKAWAFHSLNILLHIVNTGLVIMLARRWFSLEISGLVALVFALHPLQIEPVAWISGGRDLLAGTWVLLASVGLLHGRNFLATGAFVLALLCKPTVALWPLALLAVGFWRNRSQKLFLVGWQALGLLAGALTWWIQRDEALVRVMDVSLWSRPLVALDALGFYLWKWLWPVHVSADYGRTPDWLFQSGAYIYTIGLLALTLTIFWIWGRHKPGIGFLLGAVVLLFPVLGLVVFQAQSESTVADRYMYLPMIFVGLFVASRGGRWHSRWLLLPLVVLWVSVGVGRVPVWKTNAAFFTELYRQNSKSLAAVVGLGAEAMLAGRSQEAETWFRRAVELRPWSAVAWANLAQAYELNGQRSLILAEVEPRLRDAEFLRRNLNEDRGVSGMFLMVARAFWETNSWERAHQAYCEFLRRDPENVERRQEVAQFLAASKAAGFEFQDCR